MNPKINITFNIREVATGGGNQFLKALRNGFRGLKVYAERPEQADVVLFNSYQFITETLQLKKRQPGLLIVHRVDGPISLYNSPDDPRDAIIQLTNRVLADGTIFQSEWSRRENHRLGFQPSPYETIIPNAADPAIFNSEGKRPFSRSRKIYIIATSWSANWKKGFDTYSWLDEHLDFSMYEMTFVGNSPVVFQNIRHIPPMDSKQLANELKNNDIFITASQKDPCSNALIEAMSCSLPAIALKDGGHPSIVRGGGELFEKNEQIPELLEKVIVNYNLYQNRISILSLDEIVKQYYKFIFQIHSDRESGHHRAKNLSAIAEARLKTALLWWQGCERIRGKLNRVRSAVSKMGSRKR
jgi:glycosyltransferase involved in cell wall biosynthesis